MKSKSNIKKVPEGIIFECRIQPNASKDAFCGSYGDKVKISLTPPAVEGKANKALINFLSKHFKVSKSSVKILSGEHSRNKRVIVKNISDINSIPLANKTVNRNST